MDTNIKVLGWLYIVLGILGVLAGAFVLVILLGVGTVVGVAEGGADGRMVTGIMSIVGVSVALFVTILSVPGIITGFGLLKFKSWARVLALILGILNLPGFPFGTVLGVYTLISLLTEDASILFAEG